MGLLQRFKSGVSGTFWLVRAGGLRSSLGTLESNLETRVEPSGEMADAVRQLTERLVAIESALAKATADAAGAAHRHRQQLWITTNDVRAYERQVYSQNFEDGIIAEIFRRIGTDTRYFVEFGVESGVQCNCARLAIEEGWLGLFMEGSETDFAQLTARYEPYPGVVCRQARVESTNIESLFAEAGVPANLDLLSIDIDSNDYWVWQAVQSYQPRVVVIEYNPFYPPPSRWVMKEDPNYSWNRTTYFGASLGALAALGWRKGYSLIATDSRGVNAFFVRNDLFEPGKQFPDAAALYHYLPLSELYKAAPPFDGPSLEV